MTSAPGVLTSDERRMLLALARDLIAAHLTGGKPPAVAGPPVFDRRAGAFVTVSVDGELRGCIGSPGAGERLGDVIARCAVAAVSSDPRFPPPTEQDLPFLRVELSVLGPLVALENPLDCEVGRHGLVIEAGRRRGLLLPQVAVAQGWDVPTFLGHTCVKAGLPEDAWRGNATVYAFEAVVFGDPEP